MIVSECFYPEEFKINDVALAWKDQGYEVTVLTLAPTYPLGKIFAGYKNRFVSKAEYQGVKIIRLAAVTGYRESPIKKILKYLNFMIVGSVVAVCIGKKYDRIFGFNVGSLTDMLPAVVVGKLYKKPVMLWVQDLWPESVYAYGFKKTRMLSTALDYFVKFIYQNVSSLAISSKGFEGRLKPYIKKSMQFGYAPNWPDDLILESDSIVLSENKKTHFTFAGNVGKVQNLENIINAFCSLEKEWSNKAQLNIIGDGSNLLLLKKLCSNHKNVIFHGKKSREDMGKFYDGSDFLIVSLIDKPVFSVTVPAKTQTYIAVKKPILAVINGDVADIVNDNALGISVDPSNVSLISGAFKECIDMSDSEKLKFTVNNDRLLETTFNKSSVIKNLTTQLLGFDD
ncbi:glycosyltransferase family 4 protein [Porticoccaceae bacterium]|nr:glycosyltransferase family 4 protein [Porticoccaceae bacterium]